MGVGVSLHFARELHLQAARHDDAVFGLHQIGNAALTGLAIDADDGVISAAHIGRVYGQIRNAPQTVFVQRGKAFFNRVLVRATKGGEHQIAHIGVARVDGQLVAMLHGAGHGIYVGKVQSGVHALGVKVERQGDDVHVAGTLAVAKQAAFYTVGASHQAQLGGGYCRATVVMWVQADDDAVAPGHVAVHPLDLVGVNIGRGNFYRRR